MPAADDAKTAFMTLHRYWVWANRMREYFDRSLVDPSGTAAKFRDHPEMGPLFFSDDPGIFMSHWYAGLYVVIEGWQELELHDPDIDTMLASPNTQLLRRYRNGTFHFQRRYFDDRFMEFIAERETVPWVRELTRRLGVFFLNALREYRLGNDNPRS